MATLSTEELKNSKILTVIFIIICMMVQHSGYNVSQTEAGNTFNTFIFKEFDICALDK